MLRRIMRRAIQQGRALEHRAGLPAALRGPRARADGRRLPRAARAARGDPTCGSRPRRRASGARSSRACRLLDELIERARDGGAEGIARRGRVPPARHLRLPVRADAASSLAEHGLGVDEEGFERLMDEQRARARAARRRRTRGGGQCASVRRARRRRGFRREFIGYETTRAGDDRRSRVDARRTASASLVKLAESPFYAAGGGQVADAGEIACEARRLPRSRRATCCASATTRSLAVELERGAPQPGERGARARRSRRAARHRGQPHGDPPAARGAARAAGHPRAPGRLLRRARQAALRLHPRLRR